MHGGSADDRTTGPSRRHVLALPLAAALNGNTGEAGAAPATAEASRTIPARVLPVPTTVSPQLQAHIGAPYPPGWDAIPRDVAAWRELQARSAQEVAPYLPAIVERLGVAAEPGRIAGVNVFHVTPSTSRLRTATGSSCTSMGAAMCSIPERPARARPC
jgi:monoterpene epsilon-lactone hydrolase